MTTFGDFAAVCEAAHTLLAEKPMAVNAADAREMERLANEAKIKLMVNYWNAWFRLAMSCFVVCGLARWALCRRLWCSMGITGRRRLGFRRSLRVGFMIR